jgi:hypothetical protein
VELALSVAPAVAAVAPDLLLEWARDSVADAVDALAGTVAAARLADTVVLCAALPQAANATAEPSASSTVGTGMIRDTRFLLCPGISRYDLSAAIGGAAREAVVTVL